MKNVAKKPLETQMIEILERAWRPLVAAIALFVVSYGGYLGISAYQTYKESEAQEKVFVIQKNVDEITEKLWSEVAAEPNSSTAKTAAKKNQASAKEKTLEKTPEKLVEKFAQPISQYEEFIKSHKGTNAAHMAAIQLAGLAAEYKDFPRAEKVLREAEVKPSHGLFFGLVKTQLGSVLMDQAKYAEAAAEFRQVVESSKHSHFHPQALLRLGASLMESGEFDEAEKALSRLETDFSRTQAASEARNLKRLVSLRKGAKSES